MYPVLYLLCLFFIIVFLSLCFILQNPVWNLQVLPTRPDHRDHNAALVEGDYLLGVGKADITGYKSLELQLIPHMLIRAGRLSKST